MLETFHNENPSRCERKIPALSNMLLCPQSHTHTWGKLGQDGPSFLSHLFFFSAVAVWFMALRGKATKLRCFSWPSLWVFRLKWNPMGCELKLKNIFWKPNALSSIRDQIKPDLLPFWSWSSQRACHFWAPPGESAAPGREQPAIVFPATAENPCSPLELAGASTLWSWAGFCPGDSEELVTVRKWGFARRCTEALPGCPPQLGSSF